MLSLLLDTQKQICTKLRTQKRAREDVTMQSLRTSSKLLSSPRPLLNRAEGFPGPLGKVSGIGSSPLLHHTWPQVTRCQT